MTEGDVALTPLPQADGRTKPRPAILLRQTPPFGDWLICGVSTQLHQEVVGFDDIIEPSHPDFQRSGLKAASVIRLGFLTVLPSDQFLGALGSISRARHAKLLQRLSVFLATERSA
ncbi:MAG: transcriptional regulator [Chthoniobacterales bacterium]|nr:transcriptional regulator [Chthoniobacterales bacterium]